LIFYTRAMASARSVYSLDGFPLRQVTAPFRPNEMFKEEQSLQEAKR
jgi:hypothetical protein